MTESKTKPVGFFYHLLWSYATRNTVQFSVSHMDRYVIKQKIGFVSNEEDKMLVTDVQHLPYELGVNLPHTSRSKRLILNGIW